MPLQKRLPKYGFTSRIASHHRADSAVARTERTVEGDVVDLAALKDADLVKR